MHNSFMAGLVLLAVSALPASAQRVAEQMTCDELIAAFERNGVIYKRVAGKVMALKTGVPVRKAAGLQCGPRNYSLQRGVARTRDKRSCTYSIICYGKSNTELLQHN